MTRDALEDQLLTVADALDELARRLIQYGYPSKAAEAGSASLIAKQWCREYRKETGKP